MTRYRLLVLVPTVVLLSGCATARPPVDAGGRPTYSALGDWCEGRGLGSPAWCAVSAQASAWRTADQALSVLSTAAQISGMATGLVAWPMAAVSVGLGALGSVGQSAQTWCAAHPDHASVWARIRCGAPRGETTP